MPDRIVTSSELRKILLNTSKEIDNFHHEVLSRPDDFDSGNMKVLIKTIKDSQNALVAYENNDRLKDKWINIDPALTKEIISAINGILQKRGGDIAGHFQVALNALMDFQNDLRTFERHLNEESKKKSRVENIEGMNPT